jgi:lipopolysaccharide/colanic/teichoic acid biosynthesis glycosyltransferase
MKRGVDILFSLSGLALGWPVLAIIGIAVILTSGRPVLFLQTRIGLNGRPFILKKFRTMRNIHGAEVGIFEPGNQTRVTAVGRFIRASKLDELPQLWNVLMGEMSLVGPRPEIRKWVEAYPERWGKVLSIRPGITDPASLVYRNEEVTLTRVADPEKAYREIILPRKLDIYETYLYNRTLPGDLRIVLETLGKIFMK